MYYVIDGLVDNGGRGEEVTRHQNPFKNGGVCIYYELVVGGEQKLHFE